MQQEIYNIIDTFDDLDEKESSKSFILDLGDDDDDDWDDDDDDDDD